MAIRVRLKEYHWYTLSAEQLGGETATEDKSNNLLV